MNIVEHIAIIETYWTLEHAEQWVERLKERNIATYQPVELYEMVLKERMNNCLD